MSRAGVIGLRRNVATALGNTGDVEVVEELNKPTAPEAVSCDEPLVSEHVAWAQQRLSNRFKLKASGDDTIV